MNRAWIRYPVLCGAGLVVTVACSAPIQPRAGEIQRPDQAAPQAAGHTLVLGADSQELMVFSTERHPSNPERVPVEWTPVEGDENPPSIESVRWLGCGDTMAARSENEVVAIRRDGHLVGRARLPDLFDALGDRLAPAIARRIVGAPLVGPLPDAVREEYEEVLEQGEARLAVPDEEGTPLLPGPLVRTDEGNLAMDPFLDVAWINSEEEGCIEVLSVLRVSIDVAGLVPAPCPEPDGHEIELPLEPDSMTPAGWRCSVVGDLRAEEPSADSGEEAWSCAVRGSEAIRDDGGLYFEAHDQEVESVVACHPPGERRWVLAVSHAPFMGCGASPALVVVEDCRVVAQTGFGGRIRQVGGVRLYGGSLAWYVQLPGGALIPFGTTEPDVVVVPGAPRITPS